MIVYLFCHICFNGHKSVEGTCRIWIRKQLGLLDPDPQLGFTDPEHCFLSCLFHLFILFKETRRNSYVRPGTLSLKKIYLFFKFFSLFLVLTTFSSL
jgi:hypothetical protein